MQCQALCCLQLVNFDFGGGPFFNPLPALDLPACCQEMEAARKQCERLQLEVPAEMTAARHTAADGAGTIAELVLLSILDDEEFTLEKKKGKLQSTINRVTNQTKEYGQNVQAKIHPAILEATMAMILR